MSQIATRLQNFNTILKFEAGKKLFTNCGKQSEIAPMVMKDYHLTNFYQVPSIKRVIINSGPLTDHNVELAAKILELITGQLSVFTKARKSIAQKKVRKGMTVGAKVSLSGSKMYNFINKLKYAFLNNRSLEAISMKSINQTNDSCQLNIGIKHMGFFAEVPYMGSGQKIGCTITIISGNGTKTNLDKELFANVLYYNGIPIREMIEGRKK